MKRHPFLMMCLVLTLIGSSHAEDIEILHDPIRVPPSEALTDAELLKKHKIDTSSKGLADYLASLVPEDSGPDQIAAWVKQLGADAFRAREAAQTALVRIGKPAAPHLKPLLRSDDPEISGRARAILALITKAQPLESVALVIRLAARKPDPRLLDLFLRLEPAYREDLGPVLFAAVKDLVKDDYVRPLRAALATAKPENKHFIAYWLGLAGKDKVLDDMAALLTDVDSASRFEGALYFARRGDARCLDVLLALLDDRHEAVALRAENLLQQVSGHSFGDQREEEPDAKHRQWTAWLAEHRQGLTLDRPVQRMGFSLAGTWWRLVYSKESRGLKPSTCRFNKDGTMLDKAHPKNVNTWTLKGADVSIYYNSKYVHYTGRMVSTDRIEGKALNKNGLRWTWHAVRIVPPEK
jgi:hypothetical protein